jgi:DNA-binding NarL/FixJ family response regulator
MSASETKTHPRVLIVDDHPAIRRIIRLTCERHGMDVVGETPAGVEAIQMAQALHPDVIVLDLLLPDMDGFEVAKTIRIADPDSKILILSARDDEKAVFESIRAGVDGYLDKTAKEDQISYAIDEIIAGRQVFSTEQDRSAMDQLGHFIRHTREVADVNSVLTDREMDVLRLIAQGLTTRQMGSRLGLSDRTIESHISKLYRKLGAKTRVQVVMKAAALGLIDIELD